MAAAVAKRGHTRARRMTVGKENVESVDLLGLNDIDGLFRAFGVRQVRELEARAGDAASSKVTELRTMVGERYRDLLAAADSIVRMSSAANGLLDHLASASASSPHEFKTPSRQPLLQPTKTTQRTDSEVHGLSLTISLLLLLPSAVHSYLTPSVTGQEPDLLTAARLENLARVVYAHLNSMELHDRPVVELFPIVPRQWEAIEALNPAIKRRAVARLRTASSHKTDLDASTGETLAAVILLDSTDPSASLDLLLTSRSATLDAILSTEGTDEDGHKTFALDSALELLVTTLKGSRAIFTEPVAGPSSRPHSNLLQAILAAVQQRHDPSTSEAAKSATLSSDRISRITRPILQSLPNYAQLQHHLPASLLNYTPYLPSASTSGDSMEEAKSKITAWFERESARVVRGFDGWLAGLEAPQALPTLSKNVKRRSFQPSMLRAPTALDAQQLSSLRSQVSAALGAPAADTEPWRVALAAQLNAVLQRYGEQVWARDLELIRSSLLERLAELVAAEAAEEGLFDDPADDWGRFLAGAYSGGSVLGLLPVSERRKDPSVGVATSITFEHFWDLVERRSSSCIGPVWDKGVRSTMMHIEAFGEGVRDWVSPSSDPKLRSRYLADVRKMLDRLGGEMKQLVEGASSVSESQLSRHLVISRFAWLVSTSSTFDTDLLICDAEPSKADIAVLSAWRKDVDEILGASLRAWRTWAVTAALERLFAPSSTGTVTASSEPAPQLLEAVNLLVAAVHKLGLQRAYFDDRKAVKELLQDFAAEYRKRAAQVEEDRRWEGALLSRICRQAGGVAWEGSSDELDAAALAYLQRTQSIFTPLLFSLPAAEAQPVASGGRKATNTLLPLGAVPANSGSDFKSVIGTAVAGPRLGLLPVRS